MVYASRRRRSLRLLQCERLESRELLSGLPAFTFLQAGDANRDGYFDHTDIIDVLRAGKYLAGRPASWDEGDWDAAPGGHPERPPIGDGLFNQLDVIAALVGAAYRAGPYADVGPAVEADARCLVGDDGRPGDARTSIIYDMNTGELSVDAPAGTDLTSIYIRSEAGIFRGDPQGLGGSFDFHNDHEIFKATFGSSFEPFLLRMFGNVAEPTLPMSFILSDIRVAGTRVDGSDIGDVDAMQSDSDLADHGIRPWPLIPWRPSPGWADLTMTEDSPPVDHYVWYGSFGWVQHTVLGNSNPDLVTVDGGRELRLVFSEDASGTADITVHGLMLARRPYGSCSPEPPSASGETTFRVTVSPVNDSPEVVAPIEDLSVLDSSLPFQHHVDLNEVFHDVDNSNAELNYTIHANTHPNLVTGDIDDNGILHLGFTPRFRGATNITVRATDPDSLFADATFRVASLGELAPGDANRDGEFNQLDIAQVLASVKYLTGEPARWEEGDWNADGVFAQEDIVAALATGNYLQGPYLDAALTN